MHKRREGRTMTPSSLPCHAVVVVFFVNSYYMADIGIGIFSLPNKMCVQHLQSMVIFLVIWWWWRCMYACENKRWIYYRYDFFEFRYVHNMRVCLLVLLLTLTWKIVFWRNIYVHEHELNKKLRMTTKMTMRCWMVMCRWWWWLRDHVDVMWRRTSAIILWLYVLLWQWNKSWEGIFSDDHKDKFELFSRENTICLEQVY